MYVVCVCCLQRNPNDDSLYDGPYLVFTTGGRSDICSAFVGRQSRGGAHAVTLGKVCIWKVTLTDWHCRFSFVFCH